MTAQLKKYKCRTKSKPKIEKGSGRADAHSPLDAPQGAFNGDTGVWGCSPQGLAFGRFHKRAQPSLAAERIPQV